MAYNNQKGTQHTGDIQFEGDPNETQIDFENDFVAIKTNGQQRFIVSGSYVTSSIPLSCSAEVSASSFWGSGRGLTDIPASSVTPAGSDTQIQFNDAGALGASANLTWTDTHLYVSGTTVLSGTLLTHDILPIIDEQYSIGIDTLRYENAYFNYMNGGVAFDAVNDEGVAITKGQVVYIKGISGGTPTVALAACDVPAKMPAFGFVADGTINNGSQGRIVTMGRLNGIDTSTFSEGNILYVQTGSNGTSGSFTATRPTGSNNLLQNIGKVTEAAASGQIRAGGAGRTNATPNLDKGYLFVGNDSDCSVQDNTIYVSSSANRVGINTIPLDSTLEVDGTVAVSGNVNIRQNANFFQGYSTTNSNVSLIGVNSDDIVRIGNQGYDIHLADDLTVSGSLIVSGGLGDVFTINDNGSGEAEVKITGSLDISGSNTVLLRLHKAEADTREFEIHSNGARQSAIFLNGTEQLFIENESTKDIILRTNNQSTLRVFGANQRVGIAKTGITANAELDVEGNAIISGSFSVSGSSTLGTNIEHTTLINGALSASHGIHVTGSQPHIAIGDKFAYDALSGMLSIRPSDTSNKTLALMQAADADGGRIALGVSGSGHITVGGAAFDGVLNVSGSDIEKLIHAQSDSHNPVFQVSGSGEVIIGSNAPTLIFNDGATPAASIGVNAGDNLVIENFATNRNIVFFVDKAGSQKEALRLNGGISEVVVNEGSDGLLDFRVESDTNTHMLYVSGSNDRVGIGTGAPETELHINGGLTLTEKSSDPADPAEGNSVLWMSNGVGSGDDGDIMMKITAGGVTKTITLVDFSAA